MTRRISVNVGGLWRTEVELIDKHAIWYELSDKIEQVTGIISRCQKLTPVDEIFNRCKLKEGDDVFCDWKFEYGEHPLHCATENGNIEAIQSWVASGADINITNKFGGTPLMNACNNLEEECVEEMLRLGADVNMIDNDGDTALYHVMCNFELEKMEKIVKILIKAGYNMAIQNINNELFIEILEIYNGNGIIQKLEEWTKDAKCE